MTRPSRQTERTLAWLASAAATVVIRSAFGPEYGPGPDLFLFCVATPPALLIAAVLALTVESDRTTSRHTPIYIPALAMPLTEALLTRTTLYAPLSFAVSAQLFVLIAVAAALRSAYTSRPRP